MFSRVGMHAVFFGLKRAYYATLGLTRRTLRRMGLTSARMDLLYVVHKYGPYSIPQSKLWRMLGVCASVVSRMLKRLEALGYVRCGVVPGRKRRRYVALTTKGRARILRAIRLFIGWGYTELVLRSLLEPHRWHSEWYCHLAIGRLGQYLQLIRVGLEDGANVGLYC